MAATLFSRGLAACVAAIAVLNTLAGLSMPVRNRAPDPLVVGITLVLLSAHAWLYWFGDRIRDRFGLATYAVAQGLVVFAISVTGPPVPIILALFMACTAELVVLAGARWGTARITMGAIAAFVLSSLIASDLYRAATAGLMLAVTGVIAHAVAGLFHRPAPAAAMDSAPPPSAVIVNEGTGLSSREIEVLRELASGARNGDIARTLGITERTVKAHLRSIYQKLGVETRSAAAAIAVQRKLV